MCTLPEQIRTGLVMDTLTATRPMVKRSRRIPLIAEPAAAAEARRQVQAAICAWDAPVDRSVAILLTSELVTNALQHEVGDTVLLVISCGGDEFCVHVHDTSRTAPALCEALADSETGRGLLLTTKLSNEWGYYWTPAGKAVYFTLLFEADP
jgi:anti-sigma regulatory factor (Ser/Thr protein kinase)